MLNSLTELISSVTLGDIEALYIREKETGRAGLILVPQNMKDQIAPARELLPPTVEIRNFLVPQMPAGHVDSLVQIKCTRDGYPGGFAQGRTMRNSHTVKKLVYEGQHVQKETDHTIITTTVGIEDRIECDHILTWHHDEQALRSRVVFRNISRETETLEMLSSFSLWGISPFDSTDAAQKLKLHRYRSNWSAEAKPESLLLEELHIERSWSGHAAVCERFGQVGSMPVRKFFPFAAVEDTQAGVCWGVQLCEPGSWQIEVCKMSDKLCLSGGAADRELGHWTKNVLPGQSFETREAILSVCRGTRDDLCPRLLSAHKRTANRAPEREKQMPIVFNEWCTSWGNPSNEVMIKAAERLKGTGIEYLVIDAGWYKQDGAPWDTAQGDWKLSQQDFPDGLKAAADAIRQRGMIPGLWFEFEVAGKDSAAAKRGEHFLTRDGHPILAGERFFWDFRDPFTIDYLTEKVIHLLKDCGFGYLKIDYNETIGIGADGAESQGEALRQHLCGVQEFMQKIRREIPEIVIEICSSGGHRLVPAWLELGSMGSFSDAHETLEIPLIAANLHNLMLPRQLQVWSVLRKTDDLDRLVYSLSATFLGRMCLSGDIYDMNETQWNKTLEAMEFYRQVCPIIRDGVSTRKGGESQSWRYPAGTQALLRINDDSREALLVCHRFQADSGEITLELPAEGFQPVRTFSSDEINMKIQGRTLRLNLNADFTACVVHIRK